MLTLHIAEGEKCADALWEVGLVATTSQGGSGRAAETDWSLAAAFARVVIWQDVDRTDAKTGVNPGVRYAETVARLVREAAANVSRKVSLGTTENSQRRNSRNEKQSTSSRDGGSEHATECGEGNSGGNTSIEILIVELNRFWGGDDPAARIGDDVFDLIADWRQDGKTNGEIAAGLVAIAEQYHRAPGTPAALAMCGKDGRNPPPAASAPPDAGASERRNHECTGVDSPVNDGNSQSEIKAGGTPALRNILMPTDYQPPPLGADPKGREGRVGKELRNWVGAEGRTVDEIFEDLTRITGGWPCRVRSPGAKHPLLFCDYGKGGARAVQKQAPSASAAAFPEIFESKSRFSELLPGPIMPERIRWIGSGENFDCWLHERTRISFKPKLDVNLNNYVTIGNLYQYSGNSRAPEFKAVECRPHWPPIPGHYYAWEPSGSYVADGSALRGLLEFFTNCKDDLSKTVALAAIMTPGWGVGTSQPYGKKPMIVFQAPDRGCGKTTLAECISKIWNGHLAIDLTGRDQDELIQRLLTPEALTKRIGILDNVKGTLNSALLEQLVTTQLISGKRLYSGDASRPNTINYFITMNGPSCSPDVALRSYFVELQKPTYSARWDERLAEYVAERGCDVVADVGWLLSQDVRRPPRVVDRWPLWGREVLARAAEFVGVDVDAVMHRTLALRGECDDEADECNELMQGILRLVTGADGGGGNGKKAYQHSRNFIRLELDGFRNETQIVEDAKGPVFVSSTEMAEIWREVLGGKLRPRQIWRVLAGYLGAGKLRGLEWRKTEVASGYEVAVGALNEFLSAYRQSIGMADVAATAV